MPFKTAQSWRVLWSTLSKVDLVLEVVDARNPNGMRSSRVEDYIRKTENKFLMLILNKIDLVPRSAVSSWVELLRREWPVFSISALTQRQSSELLKAIQKLLAKHPLWVEDSVKMRVLVLGYPNSGKSTLINTLMKNKKRVGVSSQAGFTRGIQLVKLSNKIYLVDSPGVIPVDREDDEIYQALDTCSIIPEKIMDPESVVDEIIARVGLDELCMLYGINASSVDELIDGLGRKRGLLARGGKVREREVLIFLIKEWQRNRIPFYYIPDKNNPSSIGILKMNVKKDLRQTR
ncbi:MAG: YlqF/YawG family GTPase [Promethearchaeota archaeon]